jgi:hypothetical protein
VQSLEGSPNEEGLASLAGRPAAARWLRFLGRLESRRIESVLEPLPPNPLTRSHRYVTHLGGPLRRVSPCRDRSRERNERHEEKAPLGSACILACRARAKELLTEVRDLIHSARETLAQAVDSALTTLYWQIGRRVRRDILMEERADYGAKIVSTLGRQLTAEFGRGFDEKSLRHMIRFAEAFPSEKIVSALRRQLSWTHFKQFIYLDDPLKRDFYTEMCRIERWSTRTLDNGLPPSPPPLGGHRTQTR